MDVQDCNLDLLQGKLPSLHIRPYVHLKRKRRPRLRMQMPVRIGNLNSVSVSANIATPTQN